MFGLVSSVLTEKGRHVYTVEKTATVAEAVREMNEKGVGALLVMEGPRPVGIVSERDYTRKIAIQGRSSRDTPVREIMTAELFTVKPATTLAECMHIVTRHAVRHLPVLDDARVAGIISIGDLVSALLAQQAETIDRLNSFVGCRYPS